MKNSKLENILLNKTLLIFFILVILVVLFSLMTPNNSFFQVDTLMLFLKFSPEIALITLGMGILLIVGEIDLSVGSMYVFSSVILSGLYRFWGLSMYLAIPLTLLAGIIMGFINGFLVTKSKVTSFIITLGTMWAFRGMMLVLVGGGAIQVYPNESEAILFRLFTGKSLGFPIQFLWLVIISFVLWILLRHTRIGNWIYATGSNNQAAKMLGVKTDLVRIFCFVLCGLLCSLAGFLQVSRMNHAIPQSGDWVMLTAIAGAIIGGTSLNGGKGSIYGTLLGAFIFQVISLGFIMLGLIEYYTNIVMAIALIIIAFSYERLDKFMV